MLASLAVVEIFMLSMKPSTKVQRQLTKLLHHLVYLYYMGIFSINQLGIQCFIDLEQKN